VLQQRPMEGAGRGNDRRGASTEEGGEAPKVMHGRGSGCWPMGEGVWWLSEVGARESGRLRVRTVAGEWCRRGLGKGA
jgi:hypothetical protein